MTLKNEKRNMIFAGLVIGVIASLLVLFGNPKNMGFCVACFLRRRLCSTSGPRSSVWSSAAFSWHLPRRNFLRAAAARP